MITWEGLESFKADSLFYKAEMTYRQFKAIEHKLVNAEIENECLNLKYLNDLEKKKEVDINDLKSWLANSWNTEQVLIHNEILFDDNNSFALQWAFPPAGASLA
jgi:hypothetical protein